MAAGASLEDALTLANVAAGWEVEQLGVVPITPAALAAELRGVAPPQLKRKIVGFEPAAARLDLERRKAKTIVFTNGCFDLLHAGHVHFLQGCRAKGDFLVVGLNTDESVRSLAKGDNRPVLPLEERAAVLAGLEAVDLVVPFAESTPLALIDRLRPDVLCKGGTTRTRSWSAASWSRATAAASSWSSSSPASRPRTSSAGSTPRAEGQPDARGRIVLEAATLKSRGRHGLQGARDQEDSHRAPARPRARGRRTWVPAAHARAPRAARSRDPGGGRGPARGLGRAASRGPRASSRVSIVVLDTSIASFVYAGRSEVGLYVNDLVGNTPVLSFQTRAEMLLGAELRGWGARRRAALEAFLDAHATIEASADVIDAWVTTMASSRRSGRALGDGDAWVAACAIAHAAPLVTHDVDFRGLAVPGLVVICRAP
jgi:rfaE bifunctional protein nucleotidyltransferase chain/domain